MKNSPKGEIPWDLYFDFYQDDAITGISGGTTIKYIDTQTNTDINITNILGFIFTEPFYSGTRGLILGYNGSNKHIFVVNASGGITTTVANIRVFYFD